MENKNKMSDKELKDQGATLVVGVAGLQSPTPKWIGNISNGIIFLAMAWAMFSSLIIELPEPVKADISRWLLIITGLIKLASKFFGYKLPENN